MRFISTPSEKFTSALDKPTLIKFLGFLSFTSVMKNTIVDYFQEFEK
jgi:hypothetical protein